MPIYALVDTWNSAGTVFTGIGLNVTDTASAAGSLLLDLQVGGASRVSVRKDGLINIRGNESQVTIGYPGEINTLLQQGGLINASVGSVAWSSSATAVSGANRDVFLFRDAANTLAQRTSTNAQAFWVYRSFTDTSNYSRVYLGWSSSTAILATEGAGTGSRGNIAFGTDALATSATVGYVMIPSSAGAPTGVPADIPTGQVALHYDTVNNKIYVYNGGWVSTAALT
jgi:hypothetical protein